MKAALVILDGWGIGDHNRRNAVAAADTPTFDRLWATGATARLRTDGPAVGLPEGQMGNSEVGHLTIGAGTVLQQPFTRINAAIADGSFYQNDALLEAAAAVAETGGRIHLIGLTSEGGVHAHVDHLRALIEFADRQGVAAVTHAVLDGRDTEPMVAQETLDSLQHFVDDAGTGAVATVSGRYYAMDRDENWARTRAVYDAIVNRRADYQAPDPQAAVEAAYQRGETDEFVSPTILEDQPALEDGDAVVVFNFRPDRARQLVRMLGNVGPAWPMETHPPSTTVVTLTEYDATYPFPVAYPPIQPAATIGSVLAETGHTQLRIAESEKYPHVTYFFNGGQETRFPGEYREIVDSPDVATYDQQPSMAATTVTDRALNIVATEDPDVIILNYANPDMVGHTGGYEAAITAVEAVDHELCRLIANIEGHLFVIADHGNAEDMGTAANPRTKHTTNPVPFVYTDQRVPDTTSVRAHEGGLADIAPTLLAALDISPPPSMTGESMIAFD